MKQEYWTVRELFPNMKNQERCKIGREIHKSYQTLFAGKLPERVKEKHGKYEITVCLYPVVLDGVAFKDYIEYKFA